MKTHAHISKLPTGLIENRSRVTQVVVVRGDQSLVVSSLLKLGRLTVAEIRDDIRCATQIHNITTQRVQIAVTNLIRQNQVTTTHTDAGTVVIPLF